MRRFPAASPRPPAHYLQEDELWSVVVPCVLPQTVLAWVHRRATTEGRYGGARGRSVERYPVLRALPHP